MFQRPRRRRRLLPPSPWAVGLALLAAAAVGGQDAARAAAEPEDVADGVAVGGLDPALYNAEVMATGELELDDSRWERELSERRYRVNSDAFLSVAEQVGQFMLEGLMSHNESTGRTERNHDPWFPGCPFFDGVNKDANLGCNLIRFNKDLLTALWVDFSKTSSTTRPLNPDGTLPRQLKDFRPNPPRQVDRATIYEERPTYYYCYRLILLMYSIAFEYENSHFRMELPKLVDNFGDERYYMVDYLRDRLIRLRDPKRPPRKSPIAVSMMRDGNMLIVIRGTIWTEEWCKDFQYRWAKDDRKLFPGHTHEGMYSVFIDFYQELEAEVEARRPPYIMVTGHSLGAGLANMVGIRLQNYVSYRPRVDVVGFGGPNTGDAAFAELMRTTVNSRHVIFLGRGNVPNPEYYSAGDLTAQYTCQPYPGCGVLDTGPFGTWYDYVRPHNQVPFYPEELPNGETWNEVANVKRLPPSTKGIIATHVCSYMCWTAQAMGDPDSRCYFEDEEGRPDLPKTYYCDVSQVPL